MSATRQDVVTEARSWAGTRYHHMGRIKIRRDADGRVVDRGGADCCSFVASVYQAVGLIDPIELPFYPPDWHLHRTAERYLTGVMEHATEIDPQAALPGDLLLFKFGRAFAHGAIVLGWPRIIHAHSRIGMVHIAEADQGELVGRERRAFTLWAEGAA